MPIQKISARQIFDSRGNPTVEVNVTTELGLFRAAIPSCASTGIYVALELRDNDKSKYHGKSVLKAISNVNDIIAPKLVSANLKVTLKLIKQSIELAGYTGKIEIGMDVAASEFFKEGKYDLDFKNANSDMNQWLEPEKLADLYRSFINEYPFVSIEDPFDQDHWNAWIALTGSVNIQIVGDDLTVTNPKRIQTAVEKKACNCLLLKVNQIGTVTEAIKAQLLAKANGWGTMVSHRSDETEDTFIADLVVGLSTGQIKTGAPCRSDRLAKYNQILRIEEELGAGTKYAGKNFRNPV